MIENQLFNEDSNSFLSKVVDESADVFILDPPYMGVVKDKWDNQWKSIKEYVEWCESWMEQIYRVSKNSGQLWLFGYPYQLSHLLPMVEHYGFSFRQQIVIWKGLKSAAGRTGQSLKMYPTTTESIFFFNYNSNKLIRDILNEKKEKFGFTSKEINSHLGKATNGGGTWSCIAGKKKSELQHPTKEDWEKLNTLFNNELPKYEDYVFNFNLLSGLTDVWDDIDFYRESKIRFHPTQKPVQLLERIINTACNEESFVIDPFMGSGTTGLVCNRKNIDWIGCEKDEEYYEKAKRRIEKDKKTDIFFQ